MTSVTNNVLKAKLSTHSIAIAAVVLGIFVKHYMDDPRAVAWLDAHWALKDLIEGVQIAVVPIMAYINPTSKETS